MTIDRHTLTGAHVLHATSDTERVAFERHLAGCVPCAQEVRELHETAARLGLAATTTPPPHLRDAVLARIHTAPRTRRPAVATRLATAAAVVLLTVTLSLTAMLVTQRDDLARARHRTDVLATVLHAGDARFTHDDGVTVISSRARDRAVLLTDLPPAPDGHTYQAWLVDTRYRSAGTLDGHTMTELTGVATADQLAITVEPAGGSTEPTTTPVAEAAIP